MKNSSPVLLLAGLLLLLSLGFSLFFLRDMVFPYSKLTVPMLLPGNLHSDQNIVRKTTFSPPLLPSFLIIV